MGGRAGCPILARALRKDGIPRLSALRARRVAAIGSQNPHPCRLSIWEILPIKDAAGMGHPRLILLLANSGFLLSRCARASEWRGVWAAVATFEGSTFVGMRALWIGTILLTAMGSHEIISL
jgi:hypothetical protein